LLLLCWLLKAGLYHHLLTVCRLSDHKLATIHGF
jgi:hypothetical protein